MVKRKVILFNKNNIGDRSKIKIVSFIRKFSLIHHIQPIDCYLSQFLQSSLNAKKNYKLLEDYKMCQEQFLAEKENILWGRKYEVAWLIVEQNCCSIKIMLKKKNKINKNSKLSFSFNFFLSIKCLFFFFFFIYEVFIIDSETIKISTKLGMHIGYNPGSVIGYVKLT